MSDSSEGLHVIVRTKDLALTYCFGGLCIWAQRAAGADGKVNYARPRRVEPDTDEVTCFFRSLDEKRRFLDAARRLFPSGMWELVEV